MALKILQMISGAVDLQLWSKRRFRANGGFSLVEVIVAMAIFSTAVTIIFALLAQTQRTKKIGKEYLYAVLLVDNFLNERKLKKDDSAFFFQKNDLVEISKGNINEGNYQGRVVAFTNQGVSYYLNCSSSLLFTQPLCYRGLVECLWNLKLTNSGSFKVSTVFVTSNSGAL